MSNCLNCNIISGLIDAEIEYEDENFMAVKEIFGPQAKMHIVVFPKQHIPSLDHAFPDNGEKRYDLVAKLLETAVIIARKKGFSPDGFRTVINTGRRGTQTSFHLHLHILGGDLSEKFA